MFYKGLIINYTKENACSLRISACIILAINYLFSLFPGFKNGGIIPVWIKLS